MGYKEIKQTVRHLHISLGPSMADPAGIIVISETKTGNRVEGMTPLVCHWTGWRPVVVRWVIKVLLPTPEFGGL